MNRDEFWDDALKRYSDLVPEDESRRRMAESYFDGGVSMLQTVELAGRRPSISSFLKFAAKYQGTPFRALADFGGVEFAISYSDDFERIGVTGQTLAACMDGDHDAIRHVCRSALESMDEAQVLQRQGATHLASRGVVINPTAVKAFVLAVLDSRERYQYSEVIPELYFLLSQVLLPGETEAEKAERNIQLRTWAELLGWAYRHKHGEYPSYRKLAKILGVAPSTISRMFENVEQFELMASKFGMFGEDPSEHPALTQIYPDL